MGTSQLLDRIENLQVFEGEEVETLRREIAGDAVLPRVFDIKLGQLQEAERRRLAEDAQQQEAERRRLAEDAQQQEAERRRIAEARQSGTYLQECDGLWEFISSPLPLEREAKLSLFSRVARMQLRGCYADFESLFDEIEHPSEDPHPSIRSLGSCSAIGTDEGTDIFNNSSGIQRAHLIPDSPSCALFWGHVAEGALRPIRFQTRSRNQPSSRSSPNQPSSRSSTNQPSNRSETVPRKPPSLSRSRVLLVMGTGSSGTQGSPKLRRRRQNFVKFCNHALFFDSSPSVVIIPIMTLQSLRDWQDGDDYRCLVIASKITKSQGGTSRVQSAADCYGNILSRFNYNSGNYCDTEEIDTATDLIQSFLLGLAGSLSVGIPFRIMQSALALNTITNPNLNNIWSEERELRRVQRVINGSGVLLPHVRHGGTSRPVLKLNFSSLGGEIPDPWLLAAKAAVNLSSTRNQKLLPGCRGNEEEEEQLLAEIEANHRRAEILQIPLQVTCEMPVSPSPTTHRNHVAAVTPPEPEFDLIPWEFLD